LGQSHAGHLRILRSILFFLHVVKVPPRVVWVNKIVVILIHILFTKKVAI